MYSHTRASAGYIWAYNFSTSTQLLLLVNIFKCNKIINPASLKLDTWQQQFN